MSSKILFGFHAVTVRLKTAPESIVEIHVDTSRRDARMRQFAERAEAAGARLVDSDDARLTGDAFCASVPSHQQDGVPTAVLLERLCQRDRAGQVTQPDPR